MKPSDLLERHADIWHAATGHPFLAAVRDGGLPTQVFAIWLVQDYLFVGDELVFQAALLGRAPRPVQGLLVNGLVALESELSWFEAQAKVQNLVLEAPHHPTTAAYRAFFRSLEQAPFPVVLTALWAIERAYLDSWLSAAPGQPTYRAFVEHWTTPAFSEFVADLERAASDALQSGGADREAEAAFLEVARLERDFWEMAWSGGAR